MATKQAIFERVRALMPTTIGAPEEQQRWMNDALIGKTPDQIESNLAGLDRPFGINPTNYYHYASDYIQARKAQGQEFDMSGQVAITDMMRQLSGETPVFYDASMGGAVPRDFFGEKRRERTGESGWSNFFSNISNTVMSQAGGIRQLGAKVTDAVGVTENSTKYWQDQMEAMERILAPQGGVSGTMGKLVGNTMFSLLVGGLGPGTGAKTLIKGGWKQALKTTLKESGGVGLAFGISETGRRFGDVSARREQGQEISLPEEMTYAVAGGAMEAIGEMFGWQIARGMGRGLIGNLPGLKNAIGKEGLKGATRWLGSFSKSFIAKAAGQAPKGGVEEVATAFGQNLVDKFTDVVPENERPYGLATGLGTAFMMGSLQPLLTGIPLGLASQSIDRISGQPQEQQQLTAEQEIEALENKRDEVRKNPYLNEDEKDQAYADLDEAIYTIDKFAGQIQEEQQVIVPTERAKDSIEYLGVRETEEEKIALITLEEVQEPTIKEQELQRHLTSLEKSVVTPGISESTVIPEIQQRIEDLENVRIQVRSDEKLSETEKETKYVELDKEITSLQQEIETEQTKEPTEIPALEVPLENRQQINAIQEELVGLQKERESRIEKAKANYLTSIQGREAIEKGRKRAVTTIETKQPTTKTIASKIAKNIRTKLSLAPKKPVSRRESKRLHQKVSDPVLDFAMQFHAGQMRVDRMLEAVDGQENGQLQQMIFEPITKARQNSQVTTQQLEKDLKLLVGTPKQIGGLMLKKQIIPGLSENMAPLTGSQKIGIHLLSLQEDGLRHLIEGNGYSQKDIDTIIGSMSNEEVALSKHVQDYYAAQYEPISELSRQYLNHEIAQLDFWSPITVIEGEAPIEKDYISGLLNAAATGETLPESEFIKTRKKGAIQPIDIDAIPAFLKNINRLERFKNMLPAVKEVGEIIRNKPLRDILNDATRGTLPKILDRWLKHSAQGYGGVPQDQMEKVALGLRRNAISYLMGFNVLSYMRQPVALCRAMADSPKGGVEMVKVMLSTATFRGRKKLVSEVKELSNYMATRDMEREFREIAAAEEAKTKKRAKTTYRRLAKKPKLSERGLNWLKRADQETAAIAWKGFYNLAQSKGMEKSKAIEFADKKVSRTQAAASVEQLPDFFRGGALSRLITTFQNEANQDYNFWAHEILGETKRGKMSPGKLAYKVLMGHTLPALILGTISRGRLQKDWEEVALDTIGHTLGPIYFVGNAVVNALQGFKGRTVANLAFQFAEQTIRAVANDDRTVKDIVLPLIKTVGVTTGLPVGQALRTGEGIVDWLEDETADMRRFIWSKWQLEQGKKEKKEWYK